MFPPHAVTDLSAVVPSFVADVFSLVLGAWEKSVKSARLRVTKPISFLAALPSISDGGVLLVKNTYGIGST